jgi:hypothetical protein
MLRRLVVLGTFASAAALVGCATDGAAPSPLAPQSPSFARTQGPTDPTSTFLFPLDDASLGVRSDHLFVSGSASVYANGVCGVDSKIFATTQLSNSGDAIMQTDNPKYADHKCASYPRTIVIDYGDGSGSVATTTFINAGDIERENDPADQIAIGSFRLRALHVNDSRCGGLVYQDHIADGTLTGADSVIVTRTATDTWVVTTQPAPNDKAYCKADGQLYHIPVQFTIVSSRPLAAP